MTKKKSVLPAKAKKVTLSPSILPSSGLEHLDVDPYRWHRSELDAVPDYDLGSHPGWITRLEARRLTGLQDAEFVLSWLYGQRRYATTMQGNHSQRRVIMFRLCDLADMLASTLVGARFVDEITGWVYEVVVPLPAMGQPYMRWHRKPASWRLLGCVGMSDVDIYTAPRNFKAVRLAHLWDERQWRHYGYPQGLIEEAVAGSRVAVPAISMAGRPFISTEGAHRITMRQLVGLGADITDYRTAAVVPEGGRAARITRPDAPLPDDDLKIRAWGLEPLNLGEDDAQHHRRHPWTTSTEGGAWSL